MHDSRVTNMRQRASMGRVAGAFILAPWIVVPVSLAHTWLSMTHNQEQYLFPHAAWTLGLAYLGALVLGLPTYIWMRRHGKLGFLKILFAGAVLGIVFATAFSMFLWNVGFSISLCLLTVFNASAMAAVIWLLTNIGIRQGPGS